MRRSSRTRHHVRAEGARPRLRRRHHRDPGGTARRRRARRRHRGATSSRPATTGRRASASPTAGSRRATRRISHDLADDSFDLVVSIFGAMFAPKPFDVAKEMVRVTRPGGRIVMGNWIPNDPTLVAQILKISAVLLAAAAGGLHQPDDVGHRGQRRSSASPAPVCPRRTSRSTARPTRSTSRGRPRSSSTVFENYYGPTMNAFDAATKNGKREGTARGVGCALQCAEHE